MRNVLLAAMMLATMTIACPSAASKSTTFQCWKGGYVHGSVAGGPTDSVNVDASCGGVSCQAAGEGSASCESPTPAVADDSGGTCQWSPDSATGSCAGDQPAGKPCPLAEKSTGQSLVCQLYGIVTNLTAGGT